MRQPRKCKLCHANPAEVRDRNQPTNPNRSICRTCHAKRLLGDLEYCVAVENQRRARAAGETESLTNE